MSPSSRPEYERRMHRVLAHIDAHLDQPLDLATLADVAHFSAFHFHPRLQAALWMFTHGVACATTCWLVRLGEQQFESDSKQS